MLSYWCSVLLLGLLPNGDVGRPLYALFTRIHHGGMHGTTAGLTSRTYMHECVPLPNHADLTAAPLATTSLQNNP